MGDLYQEYHQLELMAKKKGSLYGKIITYEKKIKGTSIGRRPITSTMNKDKRRSFKKYRGQGR